MPEENEHGQRVGDVVPGWTPRAWPTPVRLEGREPSRRAAARLGFTYEGRFRHHMITKGRNRDTDWFSVTDAEWPALHREHERWLDPTNFTVPGPRLRGSGPDGEIEEGSAPIGAPATRGATCLEIQHHGVQVTPLSTVT